PQPTPEPLVAELVQAAVEGKVAEIERLLAAGADRNGEAPMKMTSAGQSALSARMMAGGGIAFPVTPLLAALAHKRVDAAPRLVAWRPRPGGMRAERCRADGAGAR